MGLVQKITSKGLLYSIGIIFNRIVPEWLLRCRRYVIFEMKSGREIEAKQKHADDGLVLRWCESEPDFRSVERVTFFSRDDQPFTSKACMAAFEDRTVAGFWYATEKFVETELGVQYELKDDETWLFAAQVDNEFRNRGIHQRVLKFMISGLNDMGYTKVLLAVNPNNKPSMYAHQKHATSLLGRVLVIRVLSMTACFVNGDQIRCDRSISWNSKQDPITVNMNASTP